MDDEEKTTIDPQWDDGSTTSEQQKVSQRLRALEFGEPSTSESLVPANAPPPASASLVVTHGSDLGRVFEIRNGKSFTIGRSLDCDIVLTDIAVSRKHFDLRNEDGSWVIADRGSGNGTLVNNDPKNGPFQLVNGDIIEVGTTTLRFDCRSTEVESEVSTISGKRQAPELARLPEPAFSPPSLPPAQLGPQALLQASRAQLPVMPTRPLVLGPHSPTLLGVDSNDSAHLLAALAARRPAAEVARVPTHVPSAPRAPAAAPAATAGKAPAASSAPLSSRAKTTLAAIAVVVVGTIVAIALVAARKDSSLRDEWAQSGIPKAKFNLPVSDLKPLPKPAPAVSGTAGAPAGLPAIPTAQPDKTRSTQTAPAAKAMVAASTPNAADDGSIMETVVDVMPKPTKSKSGKKSTASRSDRDSIEAKADSLYRSERFNEAADTLRTFARSSDRATKRSLGGKATTYTSFGKAYIQGMTAKNPAHAFAYLRSAATYDRTLGGAFEDEIATKLKQVAPQAAVAFIAADKLRDARLAVEAADRAGGSKDTNVVLVKRKLESAAAKLYAEAMADLDDNPSEAKAKFRQIKDIVDSNSQWHARASKQLAGS